MSALVNWSGVPGDDLCDGAFDFAQYCAWLEANDLENGRLLRAWLSPRGLDAASQQLTGGKLDQPDERALDLRPQSRFSFLNNTGRHCPHGDEAAAVVKGHLRGEVDGKLAEGLARRFTHRLVSWLKSLWVSP